MLTQGQLAERLHWSLSKVQRIESGHVAISETDLDELLLDLKVADPVVAEELTADVRAARQRGWWSTSVYRLHLTPATIKLCQFETEARRIRTFQPMMFPGVLQTREMAESTLDMWAGQIPAETLTKRFEARMRRRAQVFDRPDPLEYHLVLDEAVLLRRIGGALTMVNQLTALLRDITDGRIVLRVLPLSSPAAFGLLGSFTLLTMADEEILYREYWMSDQLQFDPESVATYHESFERIWQACLSPDASTRLLHARTATLLSDIDLARLREFPLPYATPA